MLLGSFTVSDAQKSKEYMKAAEQLLSNGYHKEAIIQLSRAIETDPTNAKAFLARAQSHEFLNTPEAAAADYSKAAVFGIDPTDNFLKSAELYLQAGDYRLAEKSVKNAIGKKTKNHEIYLLQCRICLAGDQPEEALAAAQKALNLKETAFGRYLKGCAENKSGYLDRAEQEFEKALLLDSLLSDAYLALADLQMNQFKFEDAIENCTRAIGTDDAPLKAYQMRSKAYSELGQFDSAIADASTLINSDGNNIDNYIFRGNLFLESGDHSNAIKDFSRALEMDANNLQATELRAICYENTLQNSLAVKDYSRLLKLAENNESIQRDYIETKLFELNRETQKPALTLLDPPLNDDTYITLPKNAGKIKITTAIEDKSLIKLLSVNQDTLLYEPAGFHSGEVTVEIDNKNLEFLTISSTDIYDNTASISFPVLFEAVLNPTEE
jgi:tetratricopeptide (TPR) repeat protein